MPDQQQQVSLDPSEVEVHQPASSSATPSLSADEVEFEQPSTPVMSKQQSSDALDKYASHSDAPVQPSYSSPATSTVNSLRQPQRMSEADVANESSSGPGGYRINPANPNPQNVGEQVKNFQTPGTVTPTAAAPLSKPSGPSPSLPVDPWYEGLGKALKDSPVGNVDTYKNPFTAAGNPNMASEEAAVKQIRDGAKLVNDNWNDTADDDTGAIMRGTDQILKGAMGASMPLLAGELASSPKAALSILTGITTGAVTGAVAQKATKAMGFSQDAQNLANTVGFFLPSAIGAFAGFQSGELNTSKANVKVIGSDRLGVGASYGTVDGKFGASIFGGGKRVDIGSAQAPLANLTPEQVATKQLTDSAISTMATKQKTDAAAAAIVSGVPPQQAVEAVTPKPPPPPMPDGMEKGVLQPQVVSDLAKAISIAPPEKRPDLVLEAHQNLAKWMANQGRVIIDGQIHMVKTPEQGLQIAAKLVNAEVAKQDEARNQAAQPAEQPAKPTEQQNPNEPAEDPQERLYQRAATIIEGGIAPGYEDNPRVVRATVSTRLGIPEKQAAEFIDRYQKEKAAANLPTVGGEGHEVVEEKPETVDAQMDALQKGNINVVMLPAGSKYMPEVPQGFKVMDAKKGPGAGRYIYNPENVSPATIRRAAENGTHGDLLGHVQTKEEIQDKPTTVVQATAQDGTPIQDSEVDASNPQAIQAQAEVLQERHPEAQVSVKPTDQVINDRLSGNGEAPQLSPEEVEEAPQLETWQMRLSDSSLDPQTWTAEVLKALKAKKPVPFDVLSDFERHTRSSLPEELFDAAAKREGRMDEWSPSDKSSVELQPEEVEEEDEKYVPPTIDSFYKDVTESLSEGRSHAMLIPWNNDNPNPEKAIADMRQKFEAEGWEWNAKDKQLEKDGASIWFRSQGKLSSPIAQWKAAPGVERVPLEPEDDESEEKPEENRAKFDFGSTQINLPREDGANAAYSAVLRLQRLVKDEDLAGKGKDVGDPHLTVRYGIKGDDFDGIRNYIKSQKPFQVELGKTDSFRPSKSSDGAAVIYAPVTSPELTRINKDIAEHGDFKESDFDYKPHVTVAYVKPEAAGKYTGLNEARDTGFFVRSIHISDRNGNLEEVKLEGKSEEKPAREEKPTGKTEVAKPTKKAGKVEPADMKLTQNWGVDHIDGHSGDKDREEGNTTKDAFLKESRKYLDAVSTQLEDLGFGSHKDAKGRAIRPTSVNEGGPATSGDVTLQMTRPDGNGIYVHVEGASLGGQVPTTDSGVSIMYRATTNGDRYGSRSQNYWASTDMSASELANHVSRIVPAEKPAELSADEVEEAPKTLTEHLYDKIKADQMPKDNIALRRMVTEFDGKTADNVRMKVAQEELEAAITRRAREIVSASKGNDNLAFTALLKLYESQPSLNIRTSTSIENQAYSTPAPLAFVADRLAGVTSSTTVYEPTAGNGMLLIAANPSKATANELEPGRAGRLRDQGFKVTEGDALKADVKPKSFDSVVANPPFGTIKEGGKVAKVSVDGYKIGQIDHLIAARALDAMKDDGKATIILGARKVTGDISHDDRLFFNWLYSHYNVASHFEVSGDLYSRQGANWPVRVINIDGRLASEGISPEPGTIQRVDSWKGVYDKLSEGLGSHSQRPAEVGTGSAVQRPAEDEAADVQKPATGEIATANKPESRPSKGRDGSDSGGKPEPVRNSEVQPEQRLGISDSGVGPSDDVATSDRLAKGQPKSEPAAKPDGEPGRLASNDPITPVETEFQVAYTPASGKKDKGVLIPTNMRAPLEQAMNTLEDEVGDIDKFVQKELGYESVDEMHDALMGLQVDSVASAIHQIDQGKAIIIGDQTGIGKGRQAASIIRWAERNGKIPVFMSVRPSLFSDMYGDLQDIGSYDITPQILNSDESITLPDGKKAFANVVSRHKNTLQHMASTGTLPAGKNALFGTYSQINVANTQRDAIRAIAPNAVFVLDESHNAGGDSSTGEFIREVIKDAAGVVYLSATYAKRPDNMPLYFKTDMGEVGGDSNAIMDAMKSGGLPLQTVVSNNLVKAGQFFRRERSYAGVDIANDTDSKRSDLHRELANKATESLRGIVAADKLLHRNLDDIVKSMVLPGEDWASGGNKASEGVNRIEFTSVVHNFVRQMLLGLKADAAADRAIDALKRGEKPLIAVDNTMGSFLEEFTESNNIGIGGALEDFGYHTVLQRALDRTRYFTKELKNGEKMRVEIPLAQLDPETRAKYDEAQKIIDKFEADIPVSPIDWMRSRIEKAGYSVAEITGRDLSVDYSDPSNPKLSRVSKQEQDDKVETTRRFNDGRLDSIILNVSGSTGISLHASERFKDQRQRHMIVAQPAQDINIFMQMLGRIHRTGQVVLPRYTILSVDLPAEKRPTALLSKKMKSLNANTSSNTESATSVKAADMLNKYGDQIVNQYLADNPKLATQLRLSPTTSGEPPADIARDATGRLAIMPVKVQEEFYGEIEDQYNAYIKYLNETGQNELEPRTLDYDAKETKTQVMVEGANPKSPFGEDAIYGEYSIKSQGKPLKPEEVTDAIKESLNGESSDRAMRALISNLDGKLAAYAKTLDPEAEGQAESVNTAANIARQFLMQNQIGSTLRININDDVYSAAIVDVKSAHKGTGNPFALSKINFKLAVTGPMRFLQVPATQLSKITAARLYENPATMFAVRGDFRDQVKIVTGNLLGAYVEMKGVRGSIINFTKADGSTEQGILLPRAFDMSADVSQDYRMRSPEHAANFLKKSKDKDIDKIGIASRDGNVRVVNKGSSLQIVTPKAKARGGRYFLDKKITAITGDFYSVGNTMRADVPRGKEVDALDAVMNKSALYANPSMADEAKSLLPKEDKPAPPTPPSGGGGGQTLRASVFGADIAAKALGKVLTHEFNAEVKPILQKASTNAALALRELKSYLAPRSVADPRALDVVMSALGKREKRAFVLERALDGYRKAVSKLSKEDQVAIGDRISLGQDQPTPEFEQLANFMRSTGDDTYKAVVFEQARAMRPALANEWARLSAAGKKEFFDLHMDGAFGDSPDDETRQEFLERAQDDSRFGNLISYLPDEKQGDAALYRLKEISDAALTYKKDYFGRIWKTAPGKDYVTGPAAEPERKAGVGGRGPLQGRKRFTKQQTLPTLAEGIARGGVPYSYNPIQMFKAVQAEHYRYITALQIWNDAKNEGARIFVKKGSPLPEGFQYVEDRIGDVSFPAASGEGMIEAGKWAMRDDYALLLNNFLSKDWIRSKVLGKGLMWAKNQLTAWRLGFSPFHAFTTATSAIGSQAGLGYQILNRSAREMSAALAGKGFKTLATSPAAPYLNYKTGASVFKYVENPSAFIKDSHGKDFLKEYPNLDQMIDAAFSGGAKLALHQDERLNSMQAFREAVAEKKALAALFHAVPALNQFLMTPLFEYYIPRVKFGAFIREYSEALADHAGDIGAGQMNASSLGRKTWDSVDDVFGQMNWDKFFWHNTFKSAIQFAFRAFTWFAGNIRLVGSALTGQMREMYDSLAYLNKQFRPRSQWEPKYSSTGAIPRIHPDMAKLLGLATTFVLGNVLLTKTLTGDNPEDWKDYVTARIGGYDDHGKPRRIVLPAIVFKDAMSLWANGAGSYLKGKESDLLSGLIDVLTNEDFRGVMIHNPESDFWKQRMDDAEHVLGSPIGIGNMLKGGKTGETTTQRVLTGAGFSNAPYQMEMTSAERKMLELAREQQPKRTQEDIDQQREHHQELLHSHTAAGRRAVAEARKPDVERMFDRLSYLQARDIYEHYANTSERRLMKPLLARKRSNLLQRNPSTVRQAETNE